jgi:hypothetical protein
MQFTVQLPAPANHADLADAFADLDPASVVDLDPAGLLRIATVIDEAAISATLVALGLPVQARDVNRLPSECCGGCGG